MDKLCPYLNDIDWAEPNLPLDLVKIKLDRIIKEMIFLMCIKKNAQSIIDSYCSNLENTLQEGLCDHTGDKAETCCQA